MTAKSIPLKDCTRFITIVLCVTMLLFPGISRADSYVTASMTLNVGDPNGAAQAIIGKAEKLKGYFTLHADDHIRVSIPVKQISAFLSFIETKGIVSSKTYDADDLSTKLILKQTTLKAREKILKQYMAVLEEAGNDKIVAVETEIIQLTEKIEDIKGQIRYLKHCTAYAKVDVFFSFHNRAKPVVIKDSSFAWLNTMNLQDLIWDFQHE